MSSGSRLSCVWIIALLALAALFVPRLYVQSKPAAEPVEGGGLFIENVGQFASEVRFLQLNGEGSVWIAADGIRLIRFPGEDGAAVMLRLSFEGANPSANLQPFNRKELHISYLKGSDPSSWHTDVPVWSGVRYLDLYYGIDLVLDSETFGWRLEARPEADLAQVRLVIEGALAAQSQGNSLLISSEAGDFELPLPALISESAEVDSLNLRLPSIETSQDGALIVSAPYQAGSGGDAGVPDLQAVEGLKWATYLGGGASDAGSALDVNASQEIFITGKTSSADFPIYALPPGPFDPENLNWDAFVAKINPGGTNLIYATFLGGSNIDSGNDISVEGATAYVVGDTLSLDFPIVGGQLAGESDAFVAAFNSNGTNVNYIKLHGGSAFESGNGIDVESGYAYITGSTSSNNIPGGPTKGTMDGFAAKFNSSGTRIYATVFGDRLGEGVYDIKVSGGNAFIVGDVGDDTDDAFVVKLGASGEQLFSKKLGGSLNDKAWAVAVDSAGRAVIAGQSESADLPVTEGADAAGLDAFMAVLNSTGTTWEYVTYLGGAGIDSARTVIVENSGGIQVAGVTSSTDFPLTADAVQGSLNGGQDAFIVRYDLAGTDPGHRDFSSYLGGSGSDSANDMALDLWGYTYLTGDTSSIDFPGVTGKYDSGLGGIEDAFIAKLGVGPTPGVVLKKFTNGFDADLAPGPSLPVGTAIQWRYDVYNTGATALSSVVVSDNRGVSVSCPATSLAAGASMSCTATGAAQLGQYSNIGTVNAQPPGGLPIVTSSDASHYFGAQPAVTLVKYVSGKAIGPWFDANVPPGPNLLVDLPVFWKYTVNNTGTVSLGNITVTDSDASLMISCPVNALPAGGSMNCSAQGIATAGQYSNLATVNATPPDGLPGISDTDPSHYYGAGPDIAVEKSISLDNGSTWQDADSAPGPALSSGYQPKFRVTVQNTGNVALTAISVSDSDFTLSGCPTSLAAGASGSCAIVTAAWTAGAQNNTASASADYTDAVGNLQNVSDNDAANYYGAFTGLDVIKEVSGDGGATWLPADTAPGPYLLQTGAAPQFRFTVKNTGNVDLPAVTFSDNVMTLPAGCASGLLTKNDGAPGGTDEPSCIVSRTWAINQQSNTATATANYSDSQGHPMNAADSDSAYYFGAAPAITLQKLTNDQDPSVPTDLYILAGDPVSWKYIITNTGNVELTNIIVTDDNGTPAESADDFTIHLPGSLGPGQATVKFKQGTAVEGSYANAASVSGLPPVGSPIQANDASRYFGANPQVSIEKYVKLASDPDSAWQDADQAPGLLYPLDADVEWKYEVNNEGNVQLTSVAVSDDQGVSVTCPRTYLNVSGPNQTMTCTASGTVLSGQYKNTGTVSGLPPGGLAVVQASEASHYFGIDPTKKVALFYKINGISAIQPPGLYTMVGAELSWTYEVKNLLLTDLSNLDVVDDFSGSDQVVCHIDSIPANGSHLCSPRLEIAKEGQHSYSATVLEGASGIEISTPAEGHYFGVRPGITIEKRISGDGGATWQDADDPPGPIFTPGTALIWKYVITNTSNVLMTGIDLLDDREGLVASCQDFSLASGAVRECQLDGVSQASLYSNTGSVSGLPPGGLAAFSASDLCHYTGWVKVYLPVILK